jgi:holin-like protein
MFTNTIHQHIIHNVWKLTEEMGNSNSKTFFLLRNSVARIKHYIVREGIFLKAVMPKLSLTVIIAALLFFFMSFFMSVFLGLIIPVPIIRIIMNLGIIVSFVLALLSPKGKLKNAALTVVIIIASLYLIGIELMGFLFRGNGFS